ncbi:MAG: hypothetical protein VB016_02475 [Methanomassiliicoccaceae archaeon]|nr:hypothetical protein [Methanomassiliicoccaceae archaeon]
MAAHACYGPGKAAGDMNTSFQAIMDTEKRPNEMNPYSAARDVEKVAGPYAKYFDLNADDDGKLKIEREKNALSFSMNRNGMFVMFYKGIGPWEDMMSCYDCRTFVEQAFDALKNELDGSGWRVSDPITAKGRLAIKFVALIVWCTTSRMLREGNSNEPARAALQSLDNVYAVGCGEQWKILEVTKRNRKLMELFDVKQPEKRVTLKGRSTPQSMIDAAYGDGRRYLGPASGAHVPTKQRISVFNVVRYGEIPKKKNDEMLKLSFSSHCLSIFSFLHSPDYIHTHVCPSL